MSAAWSARSARTSSSVIRAGAGLHDPSPPNRPTSGAVAKVAAPFLSAGSIRAAMSTLSRRDVVGGHVRQMRHLLQRCLWRHGSTATWAINGTKSIVTGTHEGNMREQGMDGTPPVLYAHGKRGGFGRRVLFRVPRITDWRRHDGDVLRSSIDPNAAKNELAAKGKVRTDLKGNSEKKRVTQSCVTLIRKLWEPGSGSHMNGALPSSITACSRRTHQPLCGCYRTWTGTCR